MNKQQQKKSPQNNKTNYSSQKKSLPIFAYPILIALFTFLIYSSARNNDFTNWDDKEYVTENPYIKDLNIKEEFKREHMGNYHPLAMISLALDYNGKEFDAKTFHTTGIIIHILASIMVFYFVNLLTRNKITGFIASLLFALHPMHVESVAWISERKDVLYGFFLLCALFTYVKYVTRLPSPKVDARDIRLYLIFTICFLLSLFSKAQAVVFPILCLLIDYYKDRKITRKVILEKVPLFIVSIIFGIVAIKAQAKFEAIQDSSIYSYFDRILFSGYGVFTYLWKLILPMDLSTFYPYPLKINGAYPPIFYIAPFVTAAFIFVVWKFLRHKKIIVFGTLFFLFSIALVLQILPVGGAVIADRYTYIPYLGLFILIAHYLTPYYNPETRKTNAGGIFIATIAIVLFSFITWQRIGVWKDSVTLWKDAESKSKIAPKIYSNLGDAYLAAKVYDSALIYLNEAVRLKSDWYEALYNRGLVFYFQKKYKEAIDDYTLAIKYNPKLARAYFNRSGTYYTIGQTKLALDDALKAKQLGYTVDDKYIEVLQLGLPK